MVKNQSFFSHFPRKINHTKRRGDDHMKRKLVVLGLFALVLIPLMLAISFGGFRGGKGFGKSVALGQAIGVIRVEGIIMGGTSGGGLLSEVSAGSEDLMEQIKEAREDDRIKVVLLRINSPGGSVPATQEVGDELEKLKKAGKKVVVSMGDVAASGGYWLAAKADRIVANPGTMTGSIGVIMETQNMQELYEKVGVDPQVIKSGQFKDIGSSSRPMTPQERQLLQTMVNDMYNQFVEVVAKGRKMEPEQVRKLADGRIFTGRQAKELGLVDELGNYYAAIERAKVMAGIKGEPELIEYGQESPFAGWFSGMGKKLVQMLLSEGQWRQDALLLRNYQQSVR